MLRVTHARTSPYVLLFSRILSLRNRNHKFYGLLTYGKLISKREKMQNALLNVVVLEVVHHVHPVSLHLLVGSDRAEHDLREALCGKRPEANPADRDVVLDERQRPVLPETTQMAK